MAKLVRTNLMSDDMDAYSQAVSGFDIRPRVLGSGPISVTQDCIDFGGVVVRFTRYCGNLLEEYMTDPNWLTIAFLMKPIRWCGHELPASVALTLLPAREGIGTISHSLDLLEFSYSQGALREAGVDVRIGKKYWEGLSYTPVNANVVAWAHELAYRGNFGEETCEAREQLIEFLRKWLSSFHNFQHVVGGSQRLEITQAVIEMIDAHPDRFLTMDEVSSALNVSEQWIRESFKSTIGINVYQYARESKLRAAYQMLTTGTHSVTSVATQLGFNHLSRFSQYYKAQFGELPIHTLRKA